MPFRFAAKCYQVLGLSVCACFTVYVAPIKESATLPVFVRFSNSSSVTLFFGVVAFCKTTIYNFWRRPLWWRCTQKWRRPQKRSQNTLLHIPSTPSCWLHTDPKTQTQTFTHIQTHKYFGYIAKNTYWLIVFSFCFFFCFS